MKKIIFSISLLYSIFSYSQLFVASSSYVYVENQFVYVKQGTELKSNAKILLRKEGQFLQGTTAASTNLGEGKLSVYQEGTVNNFAYNYWCSPVGNASTTIGNEAFGVRMLNKPDDVINSTPVGILAPNNYNGTSSPLAIAAYWIHKFLSSAVYSEWIQVRDNVNIFAGEGFTMKGTSGSDATNAGESVANNPGSAQRYDFRGKPNDGNITVNLANGKLTLTGNPYPSAIDLSAFLTAAVNTTGIAYFWEQDKVVNSHYLAAYRGGYGTYSPVSRGGTGVYVPAVFYAYDGAGNQIPTPTSNPNNNYARYFSPIGQGFMVEGNANGTTATMKNNYRVFEKEDVDLSVFEKSMQTDTPISNFLPYIPSVSGFDYTTVSTLPVPQIRINTLLNGQAIKQFVIAFDADATDGMDHAKDARNENDSANDINFLIDENECVLNVIQFDENKRLPLVVSATQNASFKIVVSDIINFNPSQNVYLFDAETNMYHDIKNGEYQFVLPQGIYKNRYEITFRNEFLSNNTTVFGSLVIYQNNSKETLFISNPNRIDIAAINLYDISGKRILKREKLSTENEYSLSTLSLAEAPYIVEVLTKDNNKMSQKVIVSKGQ